MTRWVGVWLGLFSCMALFSTGCGGSGSGTDAMVRFLMASPDAPLVTIFIDGKSVSGNLGYGNVTAYISAKPGSRHIQIKPVSGASPIFDQTISFAASSNTSNTSNTSTSNQTFLLTGLAANIKLVTLTDGGTTLTTGDGYVRVVNASAAMGAADVYIVPAGNGIGGASPVKAGLTFDQDTGYQLTIAGNYQVFMMTPGTNNALLNTGSLSLNAAQNQTVVALDGVGGTFTFAVLTDQ